MCRELLASQQVDGHTRWTKFKESAAAKDKRFKAVARADREPLFRAYAAEQLVRRSSCWLVGQLPQHCSCLQRQLHPSAFAAPVCSGLSSPQQGSSAGLPDQHLCVVDQSACGVMAGSRAGGCQAETGA